MCIYVRCKRAYMIDISNFSIVVSSLGKKQVYSNLMSICNE